MPLDDANKLGGSQIVDDSRYDLMNLIIGNALLDLDIKGASFTWSNWNVGDALIQVKLECALITPNWLVSYSLLPLALTRLGSDHFPLSLSVDLLGRKKFFSFRFEKMWTYHPDLKNMVHDWWNIQVDGTTMYRVAKKLSNVKNNVRKWNQSSFGHIFLEKEEVNQELLVVQQSIQVSGYDQALVLKENTLLSRLHNIVAKEEEFWK